MAEAAVLVGGYALVKTALGASLWNIFRRRIPELTQADLIQEEDPATVNADLIVVRKLTEDDKAGLKEAFSKAPDLAWVLKDGEKLEDKDSDDMAAGTSYLMDFIVYIAEHHGHIIKSVDKDGNYQGSIFLIPPVAPFLYKAYMIAAIVSIGKPPSCLWDDTGRKARFNAFAGGIDKFHHDVMEDCIEDHWYVLNLGVAPSAQGKRVGTRLLKQAIHLAGDKPLFLNCHNGNVAYYEKHGFQCAKNYPFESPKGTSNATYFFNAMRRDPQS